VPTRLTTTEGHISGSRYRKLPEDPARSKNLCMHGVSMRENREIPSPPVRLISGRAAQERPRPYA